MSKVKKGNIDAITHKLRSIYGERGELMLVNRTTIIDAQYIDSKKSSRMVDGQLHTYRNYSTTDLFVYNILKGNEKFHAVEIRGSNGKQYVHFAVREADLSKIYRFKEIDMELK